MTPNDLRTIRHEAGLSVARLAALFRLGKDGGRTVRRWEAGDLAVSGPVSLLYELLRDGLLQGPRQGGEGGPTLIRGDRR